MTKLLLPLSFLVLWLTSWPHTWRISPFTPHAVTRTPAPEICDNGLDDDGDGYVDLFDPDCPCAETAYQAYCPINCETLPDSFPAITLKLKWRSNVIVNRDHVYPNIVVGDINSDGITDVVTKRSMLSGGNNLTNGIIVFDGNTGMSSVDFNSIPRNVSAENYFISIADVDRDGISEFFFSRQDTIVCVNYNGSLRWKSDRLNEDGGYTVNIADFNGDGIPEVYKGNNIVNALTGRLLINANAGEGCNNYQGTCDISHTIAADLRPAPGLELAAGNTVYEVVITNLNGTGGNSMTAFNANNTVRDGLTSVGDIDGDGELDIVVVRSDNLTGSGVFVWNPRTLNLIARAASGTTGGIAFIGNVAGDCKPEIGVNFSNELYMFRYDGTTTLRTLYRLVTTDGSGYTGVTMFDFNLDGQNELVYRDETYLRVLQGNTGTTLASYRVNNGTGMEYPVVADVDGDREAEILVSGYVTTSAEQRLFCFESNSSSWAPARNVWNQPGYHVTNVNDDLTIPRFPQNQAKELIGYQNCLLPTCPAPYNAFVTQATFRTQEGCVQFPSIDLALHLNGTTCQSDSIEVCFTIENQGDKPIVDEPVDFTAWPGNPQTQGPFPNYRHTLVLTLATGGKDTVCLHIPKSVVNDSLFLVANDPGTVTAPYTFPLTDLDECRYENNMDSIFVTAQTVMVDLDTSLCAGESLVFMDSLITTAGTYVINEGSCDSVFHLRVEVHGLDTTRLEEMICTQDSFWFNQSWLNQSGQYMEMNRNRYGCDSIVFLQLTVVDQIKQSQTVSICAGDSVKLYGQWETVAGTYQHTIAGTVCDTLQETILELLPVFAASATYMLCPHDSIWLDNQWIKTPGIVTEHFITMAGCDSTIVNDVSFLAAPAPPVFEVDCAMGSIIASTAADPSWSAEWDNGTKGFSTTYLHPGNGRVTLTHIAPACHLEYAFLLPDFPEQVLFPEWHDTSVLENHTLLLDLHLNPDTWTVHWTPEGIFSCPDCVKTFVAPMENTRIMATLRHSSGCQYSLSFLITLEKIVDLYIPNVFTPNGDQVNDTWTVVSPDNKLELREVDIFDRWGNLIRSWSHTNEIAWDGRFQDKPMNPAVFAYRVLYLDQEKKDRIKTGNITLLR